VRRARPRSAHRRLLSDELNSVTDPTLVVWAPP
jgi:hypothetical protein